jgi:hypothetical protein
MKRSFFIGLSALGLSVSAPAHAFIVQDVTIWSSGSAGTIGTTSLNVAGLVDPMTVSVGISGSNYVPPLSPPSVVVSRYRDNSDWTATFGNPINDLGLYLVGWRGGVNYTFNQTPTLISGCSNGTIAGNILSLSGSSSTLCNGILRFTGTISSLSVDSSKSVIGDQIGMTFATLPVPGPLSLFGAGAAYAWSRGLRRRIKGTSCSG